MVNRKVYCCKCALRLPPQKNKTPVSSLDVCLEATYLVVCMEVLRLEVLAQNLHFSKVELRWLDVVYGKSGTAVKSYCFAEYCHISVRYEAKDL
jgi:hypothetical protein